MVLLMNGKMTRHSLFLFLIAIWVIAGCSSEKEIAPPDNLIGLWHTHYNDGLMVLQKVNAVAYNPLNNLSVIALEPTIPGQANIIKIAYNPKMSRGEQIRADFAQVTNGPIRNVRISSEYTAFSGRTRELILLKDELFYAKFDLDDEITSIEFSEKDKNILAVGDRQGKLLIIDLGKLSILNTVQLFDGEITSLAFYKDDQLLVSGNGSRVFQVDIRSGKTERTIETEGLKGKILHATGLKHCVKDRINQVLYVESEDKIITAHGWDYCRDFRVKVLDASSGRLLKEITQPKHPVFHMVWMSKPQLLVFVDHGRNLWRLSLSDLSLAAPRFLPQSLARYGSMENRKEKAAINFGDIQSLISIPGTNYLLMGVGAYFKGGSGVLLTELTAGAMKNLAHLTIDIEGNAHLFVHEKLFNEMQPPRS